MEFLSMDNILSQEDIDGLFGDTNTDSEETEVKEEESQKEDEDISEESLFEGTETKEEQGEGEGSKPTKTEESPNNNFYSSIAQALKEDGILTSLQENTKVSSSEELAKAIQEEVNSRLEETQRAIKEALEVGIEPSEITKHHNIINYLSSMKDEDISKEGKEGEDLRKNLIYQDFINRGYSKERAEREVTKSLNSGTDIEDAKEALASNKEFYTSAYNKLLEEAKKEKEEELKKEQELVESLKKEVLESKNILGGIEIDKKVREKALINITKKVHKDPDTGELLTELQRYQKEHYKEFVANLSLIFTLTDGFKNIEKIASKKINKEMKSNLERLEKTIASTSRNSDGSINFASGISPESSFGDFSLDI